MADDDDIPIANILKTIVSDGEKIFPMDTIEYEGTLWLVPQWLEHTSEEWITPARIISMARLQYRDIRNAPYPGDFLISATIPKSVFEGRAQGAGGVKYTVIERPPIRFRKPTVH